MKKILQVLIITVAFLLANNVSKAQQPTVMNTRQMHAYYKTLLNTDSVKAEQVLTIMLTYKTSLKQVVANQSLNEESKISQMKALIAEKNKQLGGILTTQQLEKIIPTTERVATSNPSNINNQPNSN